MESPQPTLMIVKKDDLKGLLSRCFSREKETKVSDFSIKISPNLPTKLISLEISGIKTEDGRELPSVIYEQFRPDLIMRISKFSVSSTGPATCEDEYRIEKKMFESKEILRSQKGERIRTVYPEVYDYDDSRLALVRAPKGPSLREMTEDGKSLEWTELRQSLYPLALLHARTSHIMQKNPDFPAMPASNMAEIIARSIKMILKSKEKELHAEDLESIKDEFRTIALETLYKTEQAVIHGSLDLSHLNFDKISYAGKSIFAPAFCDLSIFLNPALLKEPYNTSTVHERIERVFLNYAQVRKEIEEELGLHPARMPSDRRARTSLEVAVLGGALKRAASVINRSGYLHSEFPDKDKTKNWINSQVNDHLTIARELLRLGISDPSYGIRLNNLYLLLQPTEIFEPYELKKVVGIPALKAIVEE